MRCFCRWRYQQSGLFFQTTIDSNQILPQVFTACAGKRDALLTNCHHAAHRQTPIQHSSKPASKTSHDAAYPRLRHTVQDIHQDDFGRFHSSDRLLLAQRGQCFDRRSALGALTQHASARNALHARSEGDKDGSRKGKLKTMLHMRHAIADTYQAPAKP